MQIASSNPENLARKAATYRTTPDEITRMIALRDSGLSLREIAQKTGRCMESVRQSLLRIKKAKHAEQRDGDADGIDLLAGRRGPLPVGHSVVVTAMWGGLEKWRDISPPTKWQHSNPTHTLSEAHRMDKKS